MPAYVAIGRIVIGGASNCTGVFSGQNMQNNWDSHAPNLSSLGTMMGNGCVQSAFASYLRSTMLVGQPIVDQDLKSNASPMWIGP